MQCSRLLYPFAWLPRRAKHHGQKVTRLSDFENESEGSLFRSFVSQKLQIRGSAVRTKRFCSPKVRYSEILNYGMKLFRNSSKLVKFVKGLKQI